MRGRATPAAGNDGAGPRDGGAEARDESKEAGRVLDILSSPSKTSLRWAGRIRVFPDKMTVKHLPDPPAVAHSPTSANPVSGCQWSLAITDILYFEVVVLSDLGAVAIGVAQKTVPLRSHTGSEGGNNKAFGYVSRDGGIFTGNTRVLENVFRFSTGDVVGCGYRGERGEVYFTRNGQHLKTLNAVTRSLAEGLVPTVTLEGEGTVVRFNLVGPFEYNVHTMAPNDSSNGSRRNLMTPAGAGRGTLRPGTVSKKRAEDELGPYLRCRSQKRVKLLRDKVTFSAIPDGRRSEYVLVFGSRPVPRLSSKDGAGATGSMGRAFYFEVTLASTAQLPHADHPDSLQGADIYVGLAEKTLVGLPGIEDTRSIAVWGASGALLGDDERLLRESVDPQLDPEVLGEEGGVLCLTAGDVLGCGVELESGRAFFTQNGLFAGWAGGSVGGKEDPWRMPYEAELRLYPVVAVKAGGDLVTLNLDHQGTPLRPFVYDLEYLPRLPYPPGPGATVLGGTAVGADDAGGGGWEETGGR
eukprot:CAMPEP_0177698148 /NCGR_PEP_ID=MMETSP0484_2-20121128/4885_1 /TAXON_ID=354590 /ORGANISM="Rhodomonas lens, Strain RHODO" /LENGTH=524 /DNA_ID=CAMNT_0019209219 /DNA_START=311 /DNA_END=1881 /DNA_ORIENTATION=-